MWEAPIPAKQEKSNGNSNSKAWTGASTEE